MNRNSFVLSIGAAIVLASCSTTEQNEVKETYKVTTLTVSDTVYTNEYVAEINALQNVEVRSRINGFIEAIYVDEGQNVRKGQTLFLISSKKFQQELLKAQAATKSALADLKLAEIELENTAKLLQKNVIAKTEYEFAAAKVDVMKAKVEEAQSEEAQASLNLSFAEIKAPFDGVINRIPYKTSSLVEEGTLLTSISNSDEVYVYFNVSEREYLDLATERIESNSNNRNNKEDVSLMLANGEVYKHKGVIETTESEFDPGTGNIAFRAKFKNPEGLLKHGGNGKIVIEKPLENALIVPQKSTFEIQDKLYVYVMRNDSTLEQRNIVSNIRLPHLFIVETGLKEGEHIIYEGVQSVKEGDKITPHHILPEQIRYSTL